MSSPCKKQVGDQKIVCSDQEGRFFYSIIKNLSGKPNIDWDAVAEEAGYKSGAIAKVRFGQIKKKLGLMETTPASSVATTPTRPAKVTKARAPQAIPATKDKKGKGKAVAGEDTNNAEETTSDNNVKLGDTNNDSGENKTAVVFKEEFDPKEKFDPKVDFDPNEIIVDNFGEAYFYEEDIDDEEKEMIKLENEWIDFTGSQF